MLIQVTTKLCLYQIIQITGKDSSLKANWFGRPPGIVFLYYVRRKQTQPEWTEESFVFRLTITE